MKKFGILLLVAGLIALIVTLGMDTSVASGSSRVHNLGLMNEKQNFLLVFAAIAIVGAIFLAVGERTSKPTASWVNPLQEDENEALRTCPFCAEKIKSKAIFCRHCNHDVVPPADTSTPAPKKLVMQEENKYQKIDITFGFPSNFLSKKISYTLIAIILFILLLPIAFQTSVQPTSSNKYLEELSEFIRIEDINVNTSDPGGEKLVTANIIFEMTGKNSIDLAEDRMPNIRNNILLLISKKNSAELMDIEGKLKLADEIQSTTNTLLGDFLITKVIFEKLIVF